MWLPVLRSGKGPKVFPMSADPSIYIHIFLSFQFKEGFMCIYDLIQIPFLNMSYINQLVSKDSDMPSILIDLREHFKNTDELLN